MKNGPLAVKGAKNSIHYGMSMDLRSHIQFEASNYEKLVTSEDRMEALKALSENREPIYKGK